MRGQYSRNVKGEALTTCQAETPIPAGLDKHRTGVHPLVTPQACSQFFEGAQFASGVFSWPTPVSAADASDGIVLLKDRPG